METASTFGSSKTRRRSRAAFGLVCCLLPAALIPLSTARLSTSQTYAISTFPTPEYPAMWSIPRPLHPMMATRTLSLAPRAAGRRRVFHAPNPTAPRLVRRRKTRRVMEHVIQEEKCFNRSLASKLHPARKSSEGGWGALSANVGSLRRHRAQLGSATISKCPGWKACC